MQGKCVGRTPSFIPDVCLRARVDQARFAQQPEAQLDQFVYRLVEFLFVVRVVPDAHSGPRQLELLFAEVNQQMAVILGAGMVGVADSDIGFF